MTSPRTLLVIPHYRDAHRLEPFLANLVRVLPDSFSILVSDDGSPAADGEALRKLIVSTAAAGPLVLPPLMNPVNRGKGAAVYAGWDSQIDGGFDRLAFADADGAVSAEEILRGHRFWEEHAGEFDVLVGSRMEAPGRTVRRRWIRHVCGRVFAGAVSALTGLPIHDTQCGYKVLTTAAYRTIRPRLQAQGFAFDVEFLLLLQQEGCRMREFPVDWTDIRDGKVSLLRESLPMLVEVVRTRRRVRAGKP